MKNVKYIVLGLAFIVGYLKIAFILIFVLALISTLLLIPERQAELSKEKATEDKLPLWLEGVYLFTLQVMIMFCISGLGYFLAQRVSTQS